MEPDQLAASHAAAGVFVGHAIWWGGYALATRERDGAIVRGVADVGVGDHLSVRVASAELRALVESVEPR